jgi:hypothetical protein
VKTLEESLKVMKNEIKEAKRKRAVAEDCLSVS